MINANQFFEQTINETAKALISSPILQQLDILPKGQLHFLFSQIYYLVESFPGLLAALVLQTNDENILFSIIDNLIDECGGIERIQNRDYSATHSRLLKSFIEKLSNTDAVAEKSIHTKLMLSNFKKLFINSTFIEALGAMAAMEGASVQWFNHLFQKLKTRNEFSTQDLYFFELHTVMDEAHGSALKDVLIPLLTKYDNYALFKSGADTAALISKNFYLGLAEEISHVYKNK